MMCLLPVSPETSQTMFWQNDSQWWHWSLYSWSKCPHCTNNQPFEYFISECIEHSIRVQKMASNKLSCITVCVWCFSENEMVFLEEIQWTPWIEKQHAVFDMSTLFQRTLKFTAECSLNGEKYFTRNGFDSSTLQTHWWSPVHTLSRLSPSLAGT